MTVVHRLMQQATGGVNSVMNSDGTLTISPTSGIVVASLNLGNASIWTGVQTFNAGIVFNAAGAIAGTSAFIQASGAGGNLLLNAPTGQEIDLQINGVNQYRALSSGFTPATDNANILGSSTIRWSQVQTLIFKVIATSGDANAVYQVDSNGYNGGPGGASALDAQLFRVGGTGVGDSAANSAGWMSQSIVSGKRGELAIAPSAGVSISAFYIFSTSDFTTNYSMFEIQTNSPDVIIFTKAGGSGTLMDMIFKIGANTAFTITTTPVVQIPVTSALQIGTTALTVGTLGSVILPLKASAGAPNDAAGGNVDGAIVVSSGDSKIYVRVGGAWKGVAVA